MKPPRPNRLRDDPPVPIFDCPSLPPPPPATNVNQLHPGNIKVVMGVGDSISAGFAMLAGHFWDFLDLVEYRGHVFTMGGDDGAYTVPNFLKFYNPDIIGASIGWSLPLDAVKWENQIIEPWDPTVTHLNGAQSMARIDAVPAQVDYITDQINSTYAGMINMTNDWKLMTIFIGANNICPACSNSSDSQPDYYEQQMELVIEKIYNQLPRTFVQIITMFNISQVYQFAMSSDYCEFMWDTFCEHECGCMTDNSTAYDRAMMDLRSVEFNQRIYKVAQRWQDMQLPEFTVKVQPFTENLIIPNGIGLDFLSELDCFHPNGNANIAWSIGLWNNMLTPDPLKLHNLPLNMTFVCPTADSVLY